MEWISFKNRRPKKTENRTVLLLCNSKTTIINMVKFYYDEDGKVMYGYDDRPVNRNEYTHWMVIPSLKLTDFSSDNPELEHSIIVCNDDEIIGLTRLIEDSKELGGDGSYFFECLDKYERVENIPNTPSWAYFPELPKKS